ncbi:MAG: cyanophycinase [Acidobacteriota bacterium]
MSTLNNTLKTILLISLYTIVAISQERLLVIGGGDRTPDILQKIVVESGGDKGKLLVIPWAGGEQQEYFDAFREDVEKISKIQLIRGSFRPLTEATKIEFLQQLKEATGIYFTGGDQNRVMEVLKDESLLKAIKDKYKSGTFFSGSSAGTAIMSKIMITGEGDFKVIDGNKVETKEGIGLLSEIIVDQHFIVRQRQNRLIGLVLKNPKQLGVGIDEDTAVFFKNNRTGEVFGNSQVMIFDAKKEPMKVFLLKKGEKFDLQKRKKINGK